MSEIRTHHNEVRYQSDFESFTVATMTWLTGPSESQMSTCRKHFPVLSSSLLITGFVTRLTRRVPLVEQELLTLPVHLSSPRYVL